MKMIFEEIKTADALIIGSPIYICQVNGLVKTFLDRLYPLTDEKHKPRFGNRKLTMLYTYGAPVPLIFNKYITYTGKSLKAMGLLLKKNIIIHGCTNLEKVKKDTGLIKKLYDYGIKLSR
jgi:multimeric flavodoxin WrbA